MNKGNDVKPIAFCTVNGRPMPALVEGFFFFFFFFVVDDVPISHSKVAIDLDSFNTCRLPIRTQVLPVHDGEVF
jgi:hypothetical protein